MAGTKYDQGKDPLELLDPLALEGLSKVLAFGAKKYAPHNWRGGISYSRLIGALLRHTFAILRGERNDPESGLPHVDHLGCCWMFLSNQMKTRPDMDDLYTPPKAVDPLQGKKEKINGQIPIPTDSVPSTDHAGFTRLVRDLQGSGYLETSQETNSGGYTFRGLSDGYVGMERSSDGRIDCGNSTPVGYEFHDAPTSIGTSWGHLNPMYLSPEAEQKLTNTQHRDEDVK